MGPKVIAFYLPQYHPTSNNNKWWGEGFTEWTNVAKARPLFHGHYQPKIPADLGFYDLRMLEVREKQVELAKQAGINGFCYYHYWFGNGKQELERPFNEVVNSGKPDFPFCLCWANETWTKKFWNNDGAVIEQETLAEQKYVGSDDDITHFNSLLSAFKDSRYIKIDDKLVFMIYRPLAFPEMNRFIDLWNNLAIQNGFKGFYFVGYTLNVKGEYNELKQLGLNGICSCRMRRHNKRDFNWFLRKALSVITHSPERYKYKNVYPTLIGKEESELIDVFPTLMPNWDHTPRSGAGGYLFTKSTPELFERHAKDVLMRISDKPVDSQICFLKSWNEWGEGNYMEPDLKFGKGYIHALRNAVEKYK